MDGLGLRNGEAKGLALGNIERLALGLAASVEGMARALELGNGLGDMDGLGLGDGDAKVLALGLQEM